MRVMVFINEAMLWNPAAVCSFHPDPDIFIGRLIHAPTGGRTGKDQLPASSNITFLVSLSVKLPLPPCCSPYDCGHPQQYPSHAYVSIQPPIRLQISALEAAK